MSDNRDDFGIGSYFKNNVGRIIELVIIVTAVFVSMQRNIETQGQILDTVVNQQSQQTIMLRQLSITMAQMGIRMDHIEQDQRDLIAEIKEHDEEDKARSVENEVKIDKHIHDEHRR